MCSAPPPFRCDISKRTLMRFAAMFARAFCMRATLRDQSDFALAGLHVRVSVITPAKCLKMLHSTNSHF
jgi:hypothetical protein